MDDMITARLREELDAQRGSWRAIAARAGVPYETLRKVYSGRIREPSVAKMQCLLDALGLEILIRKKRSNGRRATEMTARSEG